jgi:hypothetical protein
LIWEVSVILKLTTLRDSNNFARVSNGKNNPIEDGRGKIPVSE